VSEFSLDAYTVKPDKIGDPQMLMFVGPAGGGKTRLAASASEVEGLYPVLHIDLEGSTTGTLTGLDPDRIDILRPMEVFKPEEVYQKTVAVLEGLLTNEHKYKTVIIDPADVLQRWCRAYGHDANNKFAQWEFLEDELTNPAAYDKQGKRLSRGLFHRLKAAPFLTILVLHDKQDTDADGTIINDTFQWQGQGKNKLAGIPDLVGLITRNTTSSGVATSTMKIGSSTRASSKNRYETVLPSKLVAPSLAAMYDLIRSQQKEDK